MAALERIASAIALAPTDRNIVDCGRPPCQTGSRTRSSRHCRWRQANIHGRSSGMCRSLPSELEKGLKCSVIVPQMTLPHLVFENILGRTCLAMGYLKTDRLDEARNAIQHARAKILSHPDPHLVWRIHAIDGALNARNGQWLAATGEWRQAMDRFIDLMGEQSWRGILLNQKTPAQPRGPLALLNRLPESVFIAPRVTRRMRRRTFKKRFAQVDGATVAFFGAASTIRVDRPEVRLRPVFENITEWRP